MDMVKHGYVFEREFQNSFRTLIPHGFIHKLVDTHSMSGLIKKLKHEKSEFGNFLIPKVVSDFIMVVEGVTMFVECKSTLNKTSMALANIKPHQLEFARQIEAAGGIYYFVIKKNQPRHSRVYAVRAGILQAMIEEIKPRKSIKWEMFECSDVIELPYMKGSLYDARELFYQKA